MHYYQDKVSNANPGMKWPSIRSLYKSIEGDDYDPYVVDWLKVFTPIESFAWQSIRHCGLPMRPQFPVGRVFLDFADPDKKIAIECDGKYWHNATDDAIRDAKLAAQGWRVFRVTGSECYRPDIDFKAIHFQVLDGILSPEDRDVIIGKWANTTSDGVIAAIAWRYYGNEYRPTTSKHFNQSLLSHESTRGMA